MLRNICYVKPSWADVGRFVKVLQLAKKLVLEESWKVIGKVTFCIRIKHNRNKVSVQKRIPLSSVTKAWDSVKLVSLHNAIASDVDSLHNLAWRTEFKWDIVFRFTYHPKFSLLFFKKEIQIHIWAWWWLIALTSMIIRIYNTIWKFWSTVSRWSWKEINTEITEAEFAKCPTLSCSIYIE